MSLDLFINAVLILFQQALFMYGCHMFQPHEAIIRGVIISVNIMKLLHNVSQ